MAACVKALIMIVAGDDDCRLEGQVTSKSKRAREVASPAAASRPSSQPTALPAACLLELVAVAAAASRACLPA